MYSRQVLLQKKMSSESCITYVCYIPESLAVKGKIVEVLFDGDWMNGFEVKDVYSPRRLTKDVGLHSRDYLKQRKASDI